MTLKLAIVVNVDWFFLSHRLPIALAAKEKGYDVYIVTKNTGRFNEIEAFGLKPIDFPIDRSGTNSINEIKTIQVLKSIYKEIKPDIVHHVTLKVSLYGSIASKQVGVPKTINAISGLGFAFTAGRRSLTQRLILILMKFAFENRGFKFIFQNPDDLRMFQELGLEKGNESIIIKGSGVDLEAYRIQREPEDSKIRFALPARMLKDKGVTEFVNACVQVEEEIPGRCEFILAGDIDKDNPAGYTESELRTLVEGTKVQWIGYQKDMISLLHTSHVVVLPSYREGLPKSLIEAAASGRPIITTDTVGCRECVENGINGFLVPVMSIERLSDAMIKLANDNVLRVQMGKKSRELAEHDFSIESVIDKTLSLYSNGE